MTTVAVRRSVATVACALALGVTAPVTTADAAPAAPAAAASTTSTRDSFADRLVRKLVKRVNHGERKAARKVAQKEIVQAMFWARKHGFRFARPTKECRYQSDQQAYRCSTSVLMDGADDGSAFFFVPTQTGTAPMVTKVTISLGG